MRSEKYGVEARVAINIYSSTNGSYDKSLELACGLQPEIEGNMRQSKDVSGIICDNYVKGKELNMFYKNSNWSGKRQRERAAYSGQALGRGSWT